MATDDPFAVPPTLPHRSTVPLDKRTLTDWEDDALAYVDAEKMKNDLAPCLDERLSHLFEPFVPWWTGEEDEYGVKDLPFSEGTYKNLGKKGIGLQLLLRAFWRINRMRRARDMPELALQPYVRSISSRSQQAQVRVSQSALDDLTQNSRVAANTSRFILEHIHSGIELDDAIKVFTAHSKLWGSATRMFMQWLDPIHEGLHNLASVTGRTVDVQEVRKLLKRFNNGKPFVKAFWEAFDRGDHALGIETILVKPGEPFDPNRFLKVGSVYTDLFPMGSAVVEHQAGWKHRGNTRRLAAVWVVDGPLSERPIPPAFQKKYGPENALAFELSLIVDEPLEEQARRVLAHLVAKQVIRAEDQMQVRTTAARPSGPFAPPVFMFRTSAGVGRGRGRDHRKE